MKLNEQNLYNEFIVKNKTRKKCAEIFNCSENIIHNRCMKYGIKKDPKMVSINTRKTKEIIYGDPSYINLDKMKNTKRNKPKEYWESVTNKICTTKLERYGNKNYNNSEKIKLTNLKRYGVDNTLKLGTNHKKGVEASKSQKAKNKRMGTNVDRYGAKTYAESNYYTSKSRIKGDSYYIYADKNKFESYLKELSSKPTLLELADLFDLKGTSYIGSWINFHNLRKYVSYGCTGGSVPEKEVKDYIKSIYSGKVTRYRDTEYEIDIYLPEEGIGFEFNGSFWHSERNKEKTYHYNKSLYFRNNGIHVVHIWEHEWNDNRTEVENLIKYHILKNVKADDCAIIQTEKLTYELYYNEFSLQKMSFILNKDSETKEYYGVVSYNVVVGGINKILQRFIKDLRPEKVILHCDLSKYDESEYVKAGLILSESIGPSYVKTDKREKYKTWDSGTDIYVWKNISVT